MAKKTKNRKSAMDRVKFRCYVSEGGLCAIREWYSRQPTTIQGDFIGVIENLEATPPSRWSRDRYKPLTKRSSSPTCVGIDEIRLWTDGSKHDIHHRVLVFPGPRDTDRTMVYPFSKEEGSSYFEPCNVSQQRTKEIKLDWRRSQERAFTLD